MIISGFINNEDLDQTTVLTTTIAYIIAAIKDDD
jgi:hypothetical protein